MNTSLIDKIFSYTPPIFNGVAKEVFELQYHQNEVYRRWSDLIAPELCFSIMDGLQHPIHSIPFMPVSFFKSHTIQTTSFEAEKVFESSGTTQTIQSRHYIKDLNIYKTSFFKTFELFYGNIEDWCVLGLLPAYLERENSSLVFMVDALIAASKHPSSGFYLYNHKELKETIETLEAAHQKVILIGVTFALLDFFEKHPMQLSYTTILETGGMKGRRKEITREELHETLKSQTGVPTIHGEYGMSELLSQAYSVGSGRFLCPPWMKVLVRDETDPLQINPFGKGVINVIDLANVYSCSFIATDDIGIVYEDGSFEVQGRLDNSDIRGCSLLVS